MNNEQFKIKVQKLINQYNVRNYHYVLREANILLKKLPTNPFLMNLVGSCFQKLGELEKAKKIFEDIISLHPKNIAAFNNLGNTLKSLKLYNEAEKNYIKALNINEKYPNTLQNLANLKFEFNEYEESIKLYKKAIETDRDNYLIYYNLGLVYQALGEFTDARNCLEKVIKINPKFTNADKILSRFTKYKKNDLHLVDMEERLEKIDLSDFNKANILFSLGKAYEDINEFKKSYDSLEKANSLMKKITKYNFNDDDNIFQSLIKIFDNFNFEQKKNKIDDKKIIFIVGLPRSGTSLMEQILASHSKVYGAGELSFLTDSIKREFFKDNKFIADNTTMITEEKLSVIKDLYLKNIKNFDYDEVYLSDKNPLNYLWIGFIRLIFPNSKIVHINRDLCDNFFSLYKNTFDGNMNWCFDKSDLLNYCLNYKKLMKFWNNKISNYILNINYENLISNTDMEIKKILSFCDLSYEKDCLEYYKSKRAIKTVSSAQARKPIYKSSINSYQNYEKFLGDFFKKIKEE